MGNEVNDQIFEDKNERNWFIVAIIVLIVIVLSIFRLINKESKGDFKLTPEEAKRRHERLLKLVEKKKGLKVKLAKKFKRNYLIVRIGLVVIWFGVIFILYLTGFVDSLGDALNFSEALILFLILFNFLAFGSLKSLDDFVSFIKVTIENLTYKKHLNIDKDIEKYEVELLELGVVIEYAEDNE